MAATRSGGPGPGVIVEMSRDGRSAEEVETLPDGRGGLVFGGVAADAPDLRRRVADGLRAWGVEPDPERSP